MAARAVARSVWALPFALLAAFAASHGLPRGRTVLWLVILLVGARIAAGAVGALVEGSREPRALRPSPEPGRRERLWLAAVAGGVVYFLAAAMLRPPVLLVSPLALGAAVGYAAAKSCTVWRHWMLGACLGLGPVAAWLAVRGQLGLAPLVLGAAVIFWAAGFDILALCCTIGQDRARGALSVGARWGARKALAIAGGNHAAAVWLLAIFGQVTDLGWVYMLGVVLAAPTLYVVYRTIQPEDPTRAGRRAVVTEKALSMALLVMGAADVMWIAGRVRF